MMWLLKKIFLCLQNQIHLLVLTDVTNINKKGNENLAQKDQYISLPRTQPISFSPQFQLVFLHNPSQLSGDNSLLSLLSHAYYMNSWISSSKL